MTLSIIGHIKAVRFAIAGAAATVAFFGYDQVSISSITINSIVQADTSNVAPMALMVSASDVDATGSRLLSANPIKPYQDLEFRWTITHNDDSPVEDLEGIIDPRDNSSVNPYTDQISPEGTFILREAGTYKIKLTARGMSSQYGKVVEETFTDTVVVTESAQDHLWFDGVDGDDANDGLDPWGFALTTASYTESTGELTQAGAFTNYVHDVSVNYTDRDNYIGITLGGFEGLYRIASKTDDDTIILEQKLGSDQSNVTSSDGPKEVFSGSISTDTHYHINGNSTYDTVGSINAPNSALPMSISGYNGKPKVTTTSGTTYLLNMGTGSSGTTPVSIQISNINLDCEGGSGPVGGTLTSTTDTSTSTIIFDRTDALNGDLDIGVLIQSTNSNKTTHLCFNKIEIDNQYGTTGKPASKHAMFTSPKGNSWQRSIGSTFKNDADNVVLDHFWYNSGELSHSHVSYCNFTDGSNNNYCLNTNNGVTGSVAEYISYTNNNAGNNSNWFCDFSNVNNEADTKQFDNVVVINNKVNVAEALTLHYTLLDSYFAYNQAWGGSSSNGLFTLAEGSNFDPDLFNATISRNQVYGQRITNVQLGSAKEILNNEAYQTADSTALIYKPSLLAGREFIAKDNNLYAPNNSGGDVVTSDGVEIDLATFNSDVGFTNTSEDPNWPDPANGDFGGVPTGQQVEIL